MINLTIDFFPGAVPVRWWYNDFLHRVDGPASVWAYSDGDTDFRWFTANIISGLFLVRSEAGPSAL